MVRKCVICRAPQSRNSLISFHRFPTNKVRADLWLKACNLKECHIKPDSLICSKHFPAESYDEETYWPKKKLRVSAVPLLPDITTSVQIPTIDLVQSGPSSSSYPIKRNIFAEKKETISTWADTIDSSLIGGNNNALTSSVEDPDETCVFSENQQTSSIVTNIGINVNNPRYVGDLKPQHFSTPRKAKRNLDLIHAVIKTQRTKIKVMKVQKRRLEKRVDSFKGLLEHLRESKLLSEEASERLMERVPDSMKDMIARQVKSTNAKYSPDIRAFALTLHFYSSKAYSYVREHFNNLLPHPGTIQKWYAVIDGNPGFTKESFDSIKIKAQSDKKVIVNLVVDEMSIRQLIEWDGEKYHGFVDWGTDLEIQAEATSALVFMAVALNDHWKIPLGYRRPR